jgi:hypothetical protein
MRDKPAGEPVCTRSARRVRHRDVPHERPREANMKTAPTVPNGAKQGAEAHGMPGVEASIWTERRVAA